MAALDTGSTNSASTFVLPKVRILQQPRAGLDSGDPSLATEILPGPPSVASVRQATARRDTRKPAPPVSFLPQHDPGTSYGGMVYSPVTGVGTLEANSEVDGPRRKRARVEKACVIMFNPFSFSNDL